MWSSYGRSHYRREVNTTSADEEVEMSLYCKLWIYYNYDCKKVSISMFMGGLFDKVPIENIQWERVYQTISKDLQRFEETNITIKLNQLIMICPYSMTSFFNENKHFFVRPK